MEDVDTVHFKDSPPKAVPLINLKGMKKRLFTVKEQIRRVSPKIVRNVKDKITGQVLNKYVRDAVLADGSHHAILSVWEDFIDKIPENRGIQLTQIATREWFRQELATSQQTTVTESF